jgi:histidine triad (HIT) family protein
MIKNIFSVEDFMTNCIFCKIINGEIPSSKIYEDEHVFAFLDISQTTKGHTLIIPKQHVENIFQINEDTMSHIFKVVPRIAKALTKELGASGINIVNNNGEIAGQTVFHYHVHLVPRYSKDDGLKILYSNNMELYSKDDLQTMAKQISNNLK